MSDEDKTPSQEPLPEDLNGDVVAADDNQNEPVKRFENSAEDFINHVSSDVSNLKMGDDIGLTNKDQTLKRIMIGAGWEVRKFEGEEPDLDLCAFILNNDRQTRKDPDFVFYNNRQSEEGEVKHMGDSRTGAGEGDDEMITIDLQALPFDVAAIMLVISIHDGEIKEQDFSGVRDVFLRIVNADTDFELCKIEIPDAYLEEHKGTAMKIGKIFRDGPKWRFHACTETIPKGGLRALATEYGIIVV